MEHTANARYSVYFAPDSDSGLARFGAEVLGRTATNVRIAEPAAHARWQELTRTPAHYGFHATLKAPFELQDGCSYQELAERLSEFAAQQSAISLAGLSVNQMGDFAALTLNSQSDALMALAIDIVKSFDGCRKPLSQSDMLRRKKRPLSARQLQLLDLYGYPYVDDEFRFHMTLSGPLGEADEAFVQWLTALFQKHVIDEPVLDRLAIYGQPDRGTPFVELQVCPLSTSSI